MNVEGSKAVLGGDNMVFSPINSHNDEKTEIANNTSHFPSQGTKELLRNILGPDFVDYEIKNGDNLHLPNRKKEITQENIAAVAQQSQHTKDNPIAKLSGSLKDFFVRNVIGTHEKVIESNM